MLKLQALLNKTTTLVLALFAIAMGQTHAVEQTVYLHNDALGSPVAASDASGNLLWRETYKPYGEKIELEEAKLNVAWYTGKEHNEDSGLSYFGARYYDPIVGRFMGVDPVGVTEGNPHSFNRYAYTNNNPYKYVDPDGRAAETVFDVVSLGLSITAFRSDPSFWNGVAVVYDGLAAAIPVLPGGVGVIRSGSSLGDFASDGVRLSKGTPQVPTQKTLDMALNPDLYIQFVVQKYGINLRGSGQEIRIVFNQDLASTVLGRSRQSQPNIIDSPISYRMMMVPVPETSNVCTP